MNEHIKNNLENYIKTKEPQYAILLSGKWGSGKTFFIDDFSRNYSKEKTKFIKISLFGLTNISEVNNQITIQLLNADKKWLGTIARAAKSYTKKLNLPIQDLPIDKIFKKSGELIYIFDDLERTNMQLKDILGYINYFVEQSNFKVIILANENEIKDYEFKKFKEKVIGKTFEIQQDFDTVLDVFLALASHSKDALKANKQSIKDVYDKAGYNNLRHIRQTILDFEYFYQNINTKFKENNDFLRDIIYIFFAFSIEVKKGELKVGEIKELIFVQNEDKEDKFRKILDKYSILNNGGSTNIYGTTNFLLSVENWKSILFEGNIIKNDINEDIHQTSYFAQDNEETWVKLWHFRDLEDEAFKVALDDVVRKFKANEYKEYEKILHVVAILLLFSKKEFYSDTQENILSQAKSNIDANATTELWQQNKRIYDYENDLNDSYNLGYMDEKSDKFKEIANYLKQKSQEAFNIGLKDKAHALLEDFKNNNIEALKEKLVLRDLNNVAIFSQMKVDDFIDALLTLKHSNVRNIVNILRERYRHQNNSDLKQDLEFWQSVNKILLKKIDKKKYLLKYYLINEFKDYVLKEIIAALENQSE